MAARCRARGCDTESSGHRTASGGFLCGRCWAALPDDMRDRFARRRSARGRTVDLQLKALEYLDREALLA